MFAVMTKIQTMRTLAVALLFLAGFLSSLPAQTSSQAEWERAQGMARKEGRLVIGIPPSADLRQVLEQTFKQKFGIELEIMQASGSRHARKVADEFQAGVHHTDIMISTVDNLMDRLLPMGMIDPLESCWMLPEVKEPKKLVGRPHSDRQSQEVCLRAGGLHVGQPLVQQRSCETRRGAHLQ